MPKKKPAVRNACFQIRIGSPEILLYKAKLSDMIGNKIMAEKGGTDPMKRILLTVFILAVLMSTLAAAE